MGATRPHNPAARGELRGATAPWQIGAETKNNKPALNTKLRILPSQMRLNDELGSALEALERRKILDLLGPLFRSRSYLALITNNPP